MYRNLLRDTGRLEAELVVKTHLGGRIGDVAYWNGAIDIVSAKIDEMEAVLNEL